MLKQKNKAVSQNAISPYFCMLPKCTASNFLKMTPRGACEEKVTVLF